MSLPMVVVSASLGIKVVVKAKIGRYKLLGKEGG